MYINEAFINGEPSAPQKFYMVYGLWGRWELVYAGTKQFNTRNKSHRHYKIFEFDLKEAKEVDVKEQGHYL